MRWPIFGLCLLSDQKPLAADLWHERHQHAVWIPRSSCMPMALKLPILQALGPLICLPSSHSHQATYKEGPAHLSSMLDARLPASDAICSAVSAAPLKLVGAADIHTYRCPCPVKKIIRALRQWLFQCHSGHNSTLSFWSATHDVPTFCKVGFPK